MSLTDSNPDPYDVVSLVTDNTSSIKFKAKTKQQLRNSAST